MPGCQKVAKKYNKDSYTYTQEKRNKVILCETCPLLDRSRETTENQMVYLNPSYARTSFNVNKVKDNVETICPCK